MASAGGDLQAMQDTLQLLQQRSCDNNASGSTPAALSSVDANLATAHGTRGQAAAAYGDSELSPAVISAAAVQFPLGMDMNLHGLGNPQVNVHNGRLMM